MMYKKYFGKITAAAAASAVMLSFSACGEDTMYSAAFDGNNIPAGVYIYYLMNSYYDAQSKMTEGDTDVFALTIEDKNAKDWMIGEAKSDLRNYAAVEKKFTEYGLSLADDEIASMKNNLGSLWDYYGEYYEKYGIAESSYMNIYLNDLKSDKLFDTIYGEGGEKALSDDEIRKYLSDNYALVNYIDMRLIDGEENLLKSDGKAERMKMAEEYAERIRNGEDMDDVAREYNEFFKSLSAGTDAAAETADAVPEETAPAETTVSEETVSETVSESVSETVSEETVMQTEVSPSDAEEGADDEEDTSNVWADAEEPAVTGVDSLDFGDFSLDADTSAEPEDTFVSNKKVIKRDSEVPDLTVDQKVFDEMSAGDVVIVEEDEHYYIVQKFDITEDESYFLSAKDSLVHEMKNEEFEALEKEWSDSIQITINDKAVQRYAPTMFKE